MHGLYRLRQPCTFINGAWVEVYNGHNLSLLPLLALLRQGPFTGRGKDIFRSRKSTTSRAPSMHVDDFMKFGQPVQNTHWEGHSLLQQFRVYTLPPPIAGLAFLLFILYTVYYVKISDESTLTAC